MTKNELTVAEEKTTAVAAPVDFAVAIDPSDMMIPFLKVIQSLSEELTRGKDKYNPDVKAGDIYDSVTRSIFTDAEVCIAGLKKYYTEWTPEVRGRLIGKHAINSSAVATAIKKTRDTENGGTFTQLYTVTGNELVETYGVLMVVKTADGDMLPAVLTLSKTSYSVGRQLSTILALKQRAGIPVFKMSTTVSSNSKGSWFKPTFTFAKYESDADVIDMVKSLSVAANNVLLGDEPDMAPNANKESDEDMAAFADV